MPAVFYVWGLKHAFIFQNVLEAQLDQHIWESAQKIVITFGFQKPYIQRSVWIQKKNTTQRPKNLKLKTYNRNDKTVRAFSSFCTAYCLSPSSNALLQAQWRMLKTHKEDQHCAEEEARGQWGRCCTGGEGRLLQKPVFWTTNIPVTQSPRDRQLMLSLLLDYLFLYFTIATN